MSTNSEGCNSNLMVAVASLSFPFIFLIYFKEYNNNLNNELGSIGRHERLVSLHR